MDGIRAITAGIHGLKLPLRSKAKIVGLLGSSGNMLFPEELLMQQIEPRIAHYPAASPPHFVSFGVPQ